SNAGLARDPGESASSGCHEWRLIRTTFGKSDGRCPGLAAVGREWQPKKKRGAPQNQNELLRKRWACSGSAWIFVRVCAQCNPFRGFVSFAPRMLPLRPWSPRVVVYSDEIIGAASGHEVLARDPLRQLGQGAAHSRAAMMILQGLR